MPRRLSVARFGRRVRPLLLLLLLAGGRIEAEWYRGRHAVDAAHAPFAEMGYLLYLPRATGGAPPLIVSLHGKGQEGDDDRRLLLHGVPRIADEDGSFPYAVLAPQLPEAMPWNVSHVAPVFDLDVGLWESGALSDRLRLALESEGVAIEANSLVVPRDRLWVIATPGAQGLILHTVLRGRERLTVSRLQWRIADEVVALLDRVLSSFDLDPSRVYLTGLSAGGFGAFDVAIAYPHRFAAVVPIAGGGDPEMAPLLHDLPVWAFHGAADPVNSPVYTQRMIEALQRDGADARLTLYPGMGHNVWDRAYADPALYAWLAQQAIASPPSVDAPGTTPPAALTLAAYPNPFDLETTIVIDLPAEGEVDLSLFNAAGQRVTTLVDGVRRAGRYGLRWDGRDGAGRKLAAGVYLCRLRAGGRTEACKLLLR